MTCTGSDNIFPISIEGSFDDAQRIVKDLFEDLEFKGRARLSAVNSINLARILAQCVYYIHAYQQLPEGHQSTHLSSAGPFPEKTPSESYSSLKLAGILLQSPAFHAHPNTGSCRAFESYGPVGPLVVGV